MIRTTYRNMMIAILILCFGLAFYIFRTTQDKQLDIANRQNDITRLNQEFENARTLDVALTELDNLTITEQTATQLDILRHLGLEQSELDFQLESRDLRTIGNTSLYIHNVRISGKMPYETALGLCDRLQNTKKIMLDGIEVTAPTGQDSSDISLVISGKIYGLDKTVQPVSLTSVVAPEAAGVSTSLSSPVSVTQPQPAMPISQTISATSVTSVSSVTVTSTTGTLESATTPVSLLEPKK